MMFLQDLEAAKALLQAAICRCHGSHTAEWLRETAAACMDIGLQASVSGLQMLPISYQHLAARMQAHFPEPDQFLPKMQSTTGEKYFTLLGPTETPSAVMLNLNSIISTTVRTDDIESILSSIQVTTEQLDHSKISEAPLVPAGHSTPLHNDANNSVAALGPATINMSTRMSLLSICTISVCGPGWDIYAGAAATLTQFRLMGCRFMRHDSSSKPLFARAIPHPHSTLWRQL